MLYKWQFYSDKSPIIFFFSFSLLKAVRDNLHKAFWDILEAELNDDPPEYGQAIRLVEEIKEVTTCIQIFFRN